MLTKKLDSLEEFRQQKEQLMNKFEKLENDSKQKIEDYEKRLYELEKSHIREQDRLKVFVFFINRLIKRIIKICLYMGFNLVSFH